METEKIKGVLEAVNPSKTNPKVFGLLIGGNWYNAFEVSGSCRFSESKGKEIEIEWKWDKNKKFRNVVLPKGVDNSEEDKKYNVEEVKTNEEVKGYNLQAGTVEIAKESEVPSKDNYWEEKGKEQKFGMCVKVASEIVNSAASKVEVVDMKESMNHILDFAEVIYTKLDEIKAKLKQAGSW